VGGGENFNSHGRSPFNFVGKNVEVKRKKKGGMGVAYGEGAKIYPH